MSTLGGIGKNQNFGKMKIPNKWDPGGTVSLLVGPRVKAPGRILGRGLIPGSSGHFKVFKTRK